MSRLESSQGSSSAETCPDEEEMAAFARGEIDPQASSVFEAHFDRCHGCALVITELVRIFASGDAHLPEPSLGSDDFTKTEDGAHAVSEPSRLLPGSQVGRYRTLECVGVGGMGVVYAAYDPQLDRRVALKLLRRDTGPSRERRLLREAQSMAKLTHPNVTTVHDVGTWQGHVFVAMEFVAGGTLKTWMEGRARPWSEVREVVLPAGRGLAAAHAAGLVHRDFKPDNVLIGDDGRVGVTDFGLARWEEHAVSAGDDVSAELEAATSVATDLEDSLTRTGALIGTPAYMAPEQYRQERADTATDQYAFCVVLYEALYGERPHVAKSFAELASRVVASDKIEFPSSAVPRAVRRVLRRGLSRRRADRFSSMNALLTELEPVRARRWQWGAALVLPTLMLGGGLWAFADAPGEAKSSCADEQGLASVWNAARGSKVSEAFRATPVRNAEQMFLRTSAGIDAYAEAWSDAAESVCERSRTDGGDTSMILRRRCLDQRRAALDAILGELEHADEALALRAPGAVARLGSIEACADDTQLLSEMPPPPPEHLKDAVRALEEEVAALEGLRLAGDYGKGVARAGELVARANEVGHGPLQADAQLKRADLLDRLGRSEEALGAAREAEMLATSARYHRTTASALVLQVYVLGLALGRPDEARLAAERAGAELDAAGAVEGARASLLLNRATIESMHGSAAEAERLAVASLALRDRGQEPLAWADAAYNVAAIRVSAGRELEALPLFADYVAVYERTLGHEHPEVGSGYEALAVATSRVGRFDEARDHFATAMDIYAHTTGTEDHRYAAVLHQLARMEGNAGNPDVALELLRRALALREADPRNPMQTAETRLDIAERLANRGDLEEATAVFDRARATMVETVGIEHPRMSPFFAFEAGLAALNGDEERSRQANQHAVAQASLMFGEDDPVTWGARSAWPELLMMMERREAAIDEMRALLGRMEDKNTGVHGFKARLLLARWLAEEPRGAFEARALALAAKEGFKAHGRPDLIAEAEAWLNAQGTSAPSGAL